VSRKPHPYTFEDGLVVPGVSMLARVFLFGQWAKIGVKHYNRAVAEPDPGAAFDDCLVAVSAAAFALDSYVRDLPHGRPAKTVTGACSLARLGNSGDAHHVWKVLAHNYMVPSAQSESWHPRVHELFALRGNAVHYMGQPEPLFKHPNGTHYHSLVGVYTPELARRSLELVREVLTLCLQSPRPDQRDLVEVVVTNLGGTLIGFEELL